MKATIPFIPLNPSLFHPEDGQAPEGAKTGKKTNGHTKRDSVDQSVILLIDDSDQDHALVAAALGENGMAGSLRWARSHAEAMAYFQGRPPFDDRYKNPLPSLVLLDIQLPTSDGFSILGWLRSQNADWHRVPVVMLTTSQRREEVVRAYDLGANSFLIKPSGFGELCDLLKAATDYWLKQNRKT